MHCTTISVVNTTYSYLLCMRGWRSTYRGQRLFAKNVKASHKFHSFFKSGFSTRSQITNLTTFRNQQTTRNMTMATPTPLHSFLQDMIQEKTVALGAEKLHVQMTVDNPTLHSKPTLKPKKRKDRQKNSLDVSDHTKGLSRWEAVAP